MSEKRLFKEYKLLLKKPANISNNQIINLSPVDASENILQWEAVIAKPSKDDSKYYYSGQWKLDINISRDYPKVPPNIKFNRSTPINHPNVNFRTGEICLDILKEDSWSPAWDLEHTVVAILLLIDSPEPDSPLNIDLANLFRHDKVAFESIVQYSMWKYNTFYEANSSIPLRNPSGVKASNIIIDSVYVKEEQLETPQEEIKIVKNSPSEKSVEMVRVSSEEAKGVNRRSISNIKIIQDVGEEVTKQFIAKVDEIGHIRHKKEASNDNTSDKDLFGVKKQVAHNVNKQVEKLCSQSASPEISSPETFSPNNENIDVQLIDEVTDVKEKFLRQVNDKVNEIIKNQETIKETNSKFENGSPINGRRPIKSMLDVVDTE